MAIKFRKKLLDSVAFEASSVFDVNNDGIPDIICGENWYEGPDWKKHKICEVKPEGEYFNDFSDLPLDVNGDGYLDIVTGAWFEGTLKWRENPKGEPVEWKVIDVDKCGAIETTRLFDIDKCGIPEAIPNTPGAPVVYYKLMTDSRGRGTGKFKKITVLEQNSGHGEGFGDVNSDGRPDLIIAKGWIEAPANPNEDKWTFHQEFDLGCASNPILVYDVNRDGIPDLITGHAHGFGLWWWEQKRNTDGTRTWIQHEIDMKISQAHDLQLHDIDGDGEYELVTGHRYRAHCGNDPGENDPIGIYYYKIGKDKFEKNVIDYGTVPGASGTGIHFAVADINGDGLPDIVAPGKDGLYIFENLGR